MSAPSGERRTTSAASLRLPTLTHSLRRTEARSSASACAHHASCPTRGRSGGVLRSGVARRAVSSHAVAASATTTSVPTSAGALVCSLLSSASIFPEQRRTSNNSSSSPAPFQKSATGRGESASSTCGPASARSSWRCPASLSCRPASQPASRQPRGHRRGGSLVDPHAARRYPPRPRVCAVLQPTDLASSCQGSCRLQAEAAGCRLELQAAGCSCQCCGPASARSSWRCPASLSCRPASQPASRQPRGHRRGGSLVDPHAARRCPPRPRVCAVLQPTDQRDGADPACKGLGGLGSALSGAATESEVPASLR